MINKVVLVGRLAKAPKMSKSNNSNFTVVTFPIAVERGYKPRDEKAQTVDYLYCKAFNKTGQNIVDYCQKGSTVCITGQIHNNKFQKEGEKKFQYFTEIIIENIKFLPNFGEIKSSDSLPQTPDEIWSELSDAEKLHTMLMAKEHSLKQYMNQAAQQKETKVITANESVAFVQKLEDLKDLNQSKELSSDTNNNEINNDIIDNLKEKTSNTEGQSHDDDMIEENKENHQTDEVVEEQILV